MIRTRIIPKSNKVQVTVPDNYIGKKVEVIVFAEEEEIQNENDRSSKSGNIKGFRGKLNLSQERYDSFQQHAKDIRNEWDREF
jgi:translation elongation factor EF-G